MNVPDATWQFVTAALQRIVDEAGYADGTRERMARIASDALAVVARDCVDSQGGA